MNKIVGLRKDLSELLEKYESEVRTEGYAEGFEAGRKYDSVEGKNGISRVSRLVHDKIRADESKSPNQQRAELILKAKEFVEEHTEHNGISGSESGFTFGKFRVTREMFVANAEKRTVVCLIRGVNSLDVLSRGIAKCRPNDVFNLYIGQAISLARALQIGVPVEFLEAVQPSEVVVGMVVRNGEDFLEAASGPIRKGELFKVVENENLPKDRECQIHSGVAISSTITDDTNAIYGTTS